MTLPQADPTTFVSQIFWTVVFLFIQFWISRNLVLPAASKRQLKNKTLFKSLETEIQSINQHILDLRNNMDDLLLVEKHERDFVSNEIRKEQHKLFLKQLNDAQLLVQNLKEDSDLELEKYQQSMDRFKSNYKDIALAIIRKVEEGNS